MVTVSHTSIEAVLEPALGLREHDLNRHFDLINEELYPPGSEDNPYEIELEDGSTQRRGWREAGVTCTAILAFAELHRLAVHVL